jgi:cell division protein FtsQ
VWHNPRTLELAAGALTSVAILLFAIAAGSWLLRPNLLPLREVTVLGASAHTPRIDLESVLLPELGGSFLAVDVSAARQALESLPWVRRASVRRVWPDRIEARLEEHVPLARWGDNDMVNQQGERFPVSADKVEHALPAFEGPDGSEAEVTRRYLRFRDILAPIAAAPLRVELSSRYAWRVETSNGLEIHLGRDAANDAVEVRLARFVEAYPESLGRIVRERARVDLRYPNGFALRVPELVPASGTAASRRARKAG